MSYINGRVSLDYDYENGTVSMITRGGYIPGVTDKVEQQYSFTYNAYGQNLTTKVGTRTLSTKTYDSATHNLTKLTYGANGSVSYEYDKLDRISKVYYNDIGIEVQYRYDYLGSIAEVKVFDSAAETELNSYSYEYDTLGRLIRYFEFKGDELVQQAEYTFDSKNRPTSESYFDGVKQNVTSYTYDISSGILSKTTYGNGDTATPSYDSLKRTTKKPLQETVSLMRTA